MTVTVYLAFGVFLEHTVLGRRIYAIGGNPQAARVSGINVDRVLIIVYSLCGLMAGCAGLIQAGRTNSGFPNAGIGAELEAIAAVIIGGASFFGGRGTVLGVFGGVIVMGLISNGLNLNNVSVFWQQILIGHYHRVRRLPRRRPAGGVDTEMRDSVGSTNVKERASQQGG